MIAGGLLRWRFPRSSEPKVPLATRAWPRPGARRAGPSGSVNAARRSALCRRPKSPGWLDIGDGGFNHLGASRSQPVWRAIRRAYADLGRRAATCPARPLSSSA